LTERPAAGTEVAPPEVGPPEVGPPEPAPPEVASPEPAPDWWIRPGLEVRDGRLVVGGADAAALARTYGTPLIAYDRPRFAENARRLQAALAGAGIPFLVRFALKANPDPAILQVLRGLGEPGTTEGLGIDACSPGEVIRALECGWPASAISFTGTNVSERDLDVVLAHDLRLNLDAISQVERVGRRVPGRRIGIRINPAAGAGYHEGLAYSGERPTKFGIYEDRLDVAVAVARRHDLAIETVHFHAGSGWLADGLGGFERAVVAAAGMARRLLDAGCPIGEVNVGGGLGAPARQAELPIDLDAYAAVLARHLGPLGVAVTCEPGDYIAKDAAVLLGEVVSVEDRRGTRFVGLDVGWNVNTSYFIYRFAQEIVPARDPLRERPWRVTVAGHINEAGDVFAEDYPFPAVEEGEIVAILNAGGYLDAQSSTHCLRPTAAIAYLDR
jgi:diaminopimelate decarboxylase